MNLELARVLEEKIASALELADANGLVDVAIKLNEALVLVNGVGKGPPTSSPGFEMTREPTKARKNSQP